MCSKCVFVNIFNSLVLYITGVNQLEVRNMYMPKISIITPSYNQGKYIERTILSVKNQNYPNYEHIIIDGGSTDETFDVIRKYPEIKLIVKKSNQSEALNIGFKAADGNIVGWINSDDIYLPGAFGNAVKFLNSNDTISMVYSDCQFIDETDAVVGKWVTDSFDYFRNLNYAQMIPQPTIFFRRSVFDRVGYIEETLNYAMDLDFFIRVSKSCKIVRVPQVQFAAFRVHSNSKTVSQRKKFEPEIIKIRKNHGAIIPYYLVRLVQDTVGLVKKRL